ncbi:MAG: hypothetical protein KIS67_02645 [Verrucomicrobiae bacterium]|nr:hypothetical protein [Verrucomicrobiae bacterium]
MKQFISKAKNLSQRAAELRTALQQLPPKVAEVRETIAATAGQLQQLKVDVQSSVTDLKADNEHRISHALLEIESSRGIFLDAGFELGGVELEISPVQRLLVRLRKLEEVPLSALRTLIAANQKVKTTHAILSALLQAQQMADEVELADLEYRELLVSLGPIPSIRLCWRGEEGEATEAATGTPAMPTSAPVAASVPPTSAFSQSSFFEKSTPPPLPATAAAEPAVTVSPPIRLSAPVATTPETSATSEPVPAAASSGAEADPLARFKRMPNLTKTKG